MEKEVEEENRVKVKVDEEYGVEVEESIKMS